MSLPTKRLEEVTEADLQSLIENKTAEGKTIDYKLTLPGRKDEEKKEFLYDMSSFANASGGHIVYGMKESGGIPTDLVGIGGIDPDLEIRRLDEIARDGISPSIIGLHTVAVPLAGGNFAFVTRIPQSWNPPHQVTFQKAFRFYGRGSAGKYQLDVDELRSVFALAGNVSDKIQQFRVARVARIAAGETPTALPKGGCLVMHLLPISAFGAPQSAVDLRSLERDYEPLIQMVGGLEHTRYNADGYVAWTNRSYVQLFRNGCIESVYAYGTDHPAGGARTGLPSIEFEARVFRQVKAGTFILGKLLVEPPVALAVSLLGVKGLQMLVSQEYFSTSSRDVFDRDPLLLPEVVIDRFGNHPTVDGRPLVDAVWNAAGWPSSPYFDATGKWNPPGR